MNEAPTVSETEIEFDPSSEPFASRRIRVAIVGATGYAGRELVRLLERHPSASLVRLMSSGRGSSEPRPIESSHPVLRRSASCRSRTFQPLSATDLNASDVDVVFLATPHETSHSLVSGLLERGLRVVDLSGAFRLKDRAAYPRWYGFEHVADEALAEAVYGAPELNGEAIRRAKLVSNPGCYATSVILALVPMLRAGWVDPASEIICDSKSGASGAGRTLSEKLHFAEVNENCRAYGLFNHRHVPEILQALGLGEGRLVFTPHLLPLTRGLLSTIYLRLSKPRRIAEMVELYRDFYAVAPLVRVYEEGVLPEIQAVAYTNYCDVGFAVDESGHRVIVVSALDNLGKGAAGQAIENMNLMMGLAQDAGLV
jgi:N-acetyl-gamma-glutamyl-phosphate reductase